MIYGGQRAFYPYGPRLLVFDHDSLTTTVLRDAATARAYFTGRSAGRDCARGTPGTGVPLFPMDERFRRFELRYFWP